MNRLSPFRALLVAVSLAAASLDANADVAAQWTSIASETIRDAKQPHADAQRSLGAVRDAIAAAMRGGNGHSNGNGGSPPDSQRLDAAVAVAAFAILETLYPEQRETLDARLAVTFSHIPETAAKAEGAAMGRRIATEVLRTAR